MNLPIRIFADFQNADSKGRIELTTKGTLDDLKSKEIKLESGLEIIIDDDDGLVTSGIVEFSEEENIWIAKIDWDNCTNAQIRFTPMWAEEISLNCISSIVLFVIYWDKTDHGSPALQKAVAVSHY